jgi:glycosyltransferase involved in cell wall biosynthesis
LNLVSIILLTYNRPNYLKEAIIGILNQNYKDFDLIILNNGSSEETTELINSFTDARISHIRNEINSKDFINVAFTLPLLKYFIITHDDDIMEPNFILKEVDILEKNNETVLVGTNTILIDSESKTTKQRTFNFYKDKSWNKLEYIKYYLLHGNVLPCPAIMYRTDFIIKNDLSYRLETGPMADLFLLFQINLLDGKLYMIKEPLYKYRTHQNQDSEINRIKMELEVQPHIYKLLNKYNTLSKQYLNSSNGQIISLLFFHFIIGKINFNIFLHQYKIALNNKIRFNTFIIFWSIKGILRGLKKITYEFIK